MVERFPSAAAMSQPGFASLAKEIEAGYRKAPDEAGPIYSLTIHV